MLLTASLLAGAPLLCALPQVPKRATPRPAPVDSARTLSWEEFTSEHFDLGKVLPQPLKTDLLKGKKPVPNLVKLMRYVATKQFPENDYYAYEDWLRSFGDIMRELGENRGDRIQMEASIKQMERKWPKIWAEVGPFVAAFAQADYLYGPKWRPGDNHDRDGIYMADPWRVNPQIDRASYWNNLDCDTEVYQAAVFVYADYPTVHGVAVDYARYPDDVDRDLEWIHAKRDKVFRAPADEPSWFAHEIEFEADLPFPFSTATCTMRILDRLDEDGTPFTEYYAFGEDFYWFAGRDTYLPVRDSKGGLVGTIVVAQVGLDIEGVPDGDSDREKMLRSSLGNWKRVAEPSFLQRGGEFAETSRRLPVVAVTGLK